MVTSGGDGIVYCGQTLEIWFLPQEQKKIFLFFERKTAKKLLLPAPVRRELPV
jgi:hypothetical protein